MRQQGVIRRYLPERGFGFIEINEGEADIFLHCSELRQGVPPSAIRPGVQVSFDVSHKSGRPRATDVALA
jgi:cold shock protein